MWVTLLSRSTRARHHDGSGQYRRFFATYQRTNLPGKGRYRSVPGDAPVTINRGIELLRSAHRNADERPTGRVMKCLLRDVHGDPVGLHDVAHVPIRAHRPVVTEGLYARLQRDHVPSRLGSGYPRLVRRY